MFKFVYINNIDDIKKIYNLKDQKLNIINNYIGRYDDGSYSGSCYDESYMIKLRQEYQLLINNLHSNLTHLILSYDFNGCIDNLPDSIEHLNLPSTFTYPIHKLPSSLKLLVFNNSYYKENINYLPKSILCIHMYSYQQKLFSKLILDEHRIIFIDLYNDQKYNHKRYNNIYFDYPIISIWSKNNHKYWEFDFKNKVLIILLLHQVKTIFDILPYELLIYIIEFISMEY